MLKLGSVEFAGRGYQNGGIDSAANFIRNEFIHNNIKPVSDKYFQPFYIKVNNITKSVLIMDSDTLNPGKEFIFDIHTSGVDGVFSVLSVTEEIRKNKKKLAKLSAKAEGKVLVLYKNQASDADAHKWYQNIAYNNPWNAAGIVLLDSTNYTYSVALYSTLEKYFVARLHPSAFPTKPVKKVECHIEAKYFPKFPVNNVVAYLQGQEFADSFIVITAHYDHLGKMGPAIFPGGNDNASGIAMMLDLAKNIKNNSFRPRYSILFIALASEETGMNGSTFFAENPMVDLKKMKFLINLDMVGTGSTGITVVNATKFPTQFAKLKSLNDSAKYISNVKERGESCNSDHCPFYKKGVPSFFIYTTGNEYLEYHNVNDKPENVPLTAYNGVYRLLEAFIYSF
jgi:Iap family predicted aminopeptidase